MSYSVLEQLRSSHEDLENIERAISLAMMDKHKNVRHGVTCDHSVRYLMDAAQQRCKKAGEIYQDKDGMRTDDINALAGQRGDKKQSDVWTSFYDKVKEVKDYHRRFSQNQGAVPELQSAHWFYERAFEADKTDTLFSGEEEWGKRLDLNEHFVRFVNMNKITKYRKQRFMEVTFSRMKRKNPQVTADDPLVKATVEKEYVELDYIKWLKEFDQFHEIPRWCKYRDQEYTDYLQGLIDYLRGFLERSQPLVDASKLEQQFDKEFNERWKDRSIPGWEEPTHKNSQFSLVTNKLFVNPASMKSHQASKGYKRKLSEIQKLPLEEQKAQTAVSEAEDKRIAHLESTAGKWRDLLSDLLTETVQYLQKKQSQTADEMEAEKDLDDESEDEGEDAPSDFDPNDETERPIYNPLNLPLGWDGKPIPFWLYKLHGLGHEFKCEICGNYSYWGRRAFEKHFSEWRHAFGMRCLKIPNTAHFKDITRIEEAITLYEKLKRDAEEQTFRPDNDVECEDIQGNVMSQKAFEDLRRQGLV
jgi:hypothetical protein